MLWSKVNILVIPCAIVLLVGCAMHVDAKPLDIYDDLMISDDQILHQMAEIIGSIGSMGSNEDSGRLAPSDASDNQATPVAEEKKQLRAVDRCMLPVRKGVCRALIPRWNYDPVTKTCKEFKFGGCDGNSNNFSTRKQCLDTCEGL